MFTFLRLELKFGYDSSKYFDSISLISSIASFSLEVHLNLMLTDVNSVRYWSVCDLLSQRSLP